MDVYKLVQINPLPDGLCEKLTRYDHILFAEECIENGGIEAHLVQLCRSIVGRVILLCAACAAAVPFRMLP